MQPSSVKHEHPLRRYTLAVQSRLNAVRLGFVFIRGNSFKIPENIKVAGRFVPLHYPTEHGASSDFLACFIRNDYGLRKQLRNVERILDIGANVGFFSVAARSSYPHATIHAYEPNPRVLPFLKSNTDLLGIDVYPEAVGAQIDRVSIVDGGDCNLARTTAAADGAISQVSLECAIDRIGGSVDLLKLDCEGAEWDLFRCPEAWRRVRNIRMEYHLFHGETMEDVEDALNSLGFDAFEWQPNSGFGVVWARRRARSA
jgi:FkbM family methyltransferase